MTELCPPPDLVAVQAKDLCPPPPPDISAAISRQRMRTCKLCKFTTINPRDFLHHQINAHSQDPEVTSCDLCDYMATSEADLKRHKLQHTQNSKRLSMDESEPGTPTSVDTADSQFDMPPSDGKGEEPMVVRSGVNLPTRTYTCTECGWSTTSSRQNLYHMVKDHGYDYSVYECDICDYATRYKQKLPRHRKCHFMSPVASPTLASPQPITIAPLMSMASMEENDGDAMRSPVKDINENVKTNLNFASEAHAMSNQEKENADGLTTMSAKEQGLKLNEFAFGGELVPQSRLIQNIQTKPMAVIASLNNNVSVEEDRPLVIDTDRPSLVPERTLFSLEKKSDTPSLPKPKKTGGPIREAVDPAKYIRVQDVDGIKYACSKCGNIYKWRKSLNKHWKEKHEGEIPTPVNPARFTMLNVPRGNGSRALATLPIVKSTAVSKPMPKPYMSTSKSFLNSDSPTMVKDVYRNPMVYEMRPVSSSTSIDSKSKWPSVSAELEAMRAKWGIPSSTSESKNASRLSLGTSTGSMGMQHVSPSSSAPKSIVSRYLESKPIYSSGKPSSDHGDSYNSSNYSSIPAAHSQGLPEPSEPCEEAPLDLSMGSVSTRHQDSSDVLDLSHGRSSGHMDTGLSLSLSMDMSRYPSVSKMMLDNLLPCYRCSYKAQTQRENEDHQEFHRQEWHMCAVCEKQFPAVEELNVHFASKHAEVLHERCLSERDREEFRNRIKKDNTPDSLQLFHYLTAPRDSSKLYCVVCALYYTWESDLAKHFDENHQGLPNPYKKRSRPMAEAPDSVPEHKRMRFTDEDMLQCGQCSFTAREPGELKRHFLVHSLNRPFACTMCGYSTRWKHDLQQHMQRYHENEGPEQPEPMKETLVVEEDPVEQKEEEDLSSGPEDSVDKQQYLSSLGLYSNNSPISYKKTSVSPSAMKNSDLPVTPPRSMESPSRKTKQGSTPKPGTASTEALLPYKCNTCEYRARWPSEIAQHMKNHSDEKPFHCPRCSYKSKWKWDVVKHLKRCGGGTVKDVIDTTKERENAKPQWSRPLNFKTSSSPNLSSGPPNMTVVQDSVKEDAQQSEDAKLIPYSRGEDGEVSKRNQSSAYVHCLQCNFSGTSQWELERHMRLHSEDKPFVCQTCGYCSKWKCDLKKHLRTYNHSAPDIVSMDDSDETVQSKTDSGGWDNYPHSDSDEEPAYEKPELLKCDQCQYATTKKNQLDSHMKIHQQTSVKKSGGLKCKQCDYESSDLPSFLQHKLSHAAGNVEPPQSPRNEADHEGSVERDSAMQVSPRNRRKPAKPYSCPKCAFSCFQKLQLEGHMLTHDELDEEIQCGLCDFKTDAQDTLEEHVRSVHDIADVDQDVADATRKASPRKSTASSYQCTKCPYLTNHKANYEKHIRSHGLNLRFKCDWCDWSIDRLNLLLRHSRCVHPKEMAEKERQATSNNNCVSSSVSLDSDQVVLSNLRQDYNSAKPSGSNSHINTKRRMKTRYECNKCRFAVFSLSKMLCHKKMHLLKAKYQKKPSKVSMKWDFVPTKNRVLNGSIPAKTENNLTTQFVNDSPKAHKCTLCPYGTKTLNEYKIHMGHHGSAEKHRCDHCNYSVDRMNSLTHHRKLHAKQPGFDPNVSADSLKNPEYVEPATNGDAESEEESDTPVSGKQGPLQCAMCPYQCTRIGSMRHHEKLHGANKKHVCDECNWSSDRANLLLQHKRVHETPSDSEEENKPQNDDSENSGDILFQCQSCDFNTQNIRSFGMHQKDHQTDGLNNNLGAELKANLNKTSPNGKRFKCSHCPYHTANPALLGDHIKQHN